MTLLVRTAGDPEAILPALRREAKALDPDLPVTAVPMEEFLGTALLPQRVAATLLGIFGLLGLALAAVGLYGVMAYTVSQRTREIGIRMALGARADDVRRMVVRQGMTLTLVGLGVGLVLALAATRLVSSLLFGISATDPLTFAAVVLILAAVASVASYVPARRATRVDPLAALRYE
jgi:putative ABC transport system permease protein